MKVAALHEGAAAFLMWRLTMNHETIRLWI